MPGRHRNVDWTAISGIAARQHGLITVQQAHGCGLTHTSLRRLWERQGWERIDRGVFAPPGSVDGPERRVAAALLRVGPPVAATGWTAAWLHGLRSARPTRTEIVVPATRRSPRGTGLAVRRTRVWREDHLSVARGLRVVTAARMICDLGAVATADALRPLLLDARQRRLLTVDGLARTAAQLGTAAGVATVRQVLSSLRPGIGDSELEWRWRRVLEDHGLHPDDAPTYVAVSGGRLVQVDIPFATFKVGLETDSQGFHADRASLDADALRHNGLMASGWVVLRATWSHLRSPQPIIGALRDALMARGWPAKTD